MNRKDVLTEKQLGLFQEIDQLYNQLDNQFQQKLKRSLPFNETLFDRWQRAEKLGFGKETSIYDSSLVFGEVTVGENCWIGPFTVIDGSGGLDIGNFCTISVGVHIYTHDNVKSTLTSGRKPIERTPVKIGNNVYVGPNTIITKGVTIGNYCVVGANSFVNKDIEDFSLVIGQPAKKVANVYVENDVVKFEYL